MALKCVVFLKAPCFFINRGEAIRRDDRIPSLNDSNENFWESLPPYGNYQLYYAKLTASF